MQIHDTTTAPVTRQGSTAGTMRRAISFSAAAGLAAVVGLSLSSTATAAKDDDPGGCSNRTLRGDYGILISGSRPLGPGVVEKFVATAIRTYDGHGGFTQIDNFFGEIAGQQQDVPAYGTYEVKANCSGTSQIFFPGAPAAVDTAFVIVANGNEVKDATFGLTTASLWRVGR
jgi:hypothetical protein